MEKTSKKYSYLLIAVKIIIIIMFVMVAIRGFNLTYFHWDINGGIKNGYLTFFKIGYQNSYFRPFIILLLPIIGLFFNGKTGWIMIMAYFYFVISRSIYSTILNGLNDMFDILLFVIAIVIFTPIILLFNTDKVSNDIYKIPKHDLLSKNLIAFVAGALITLLISY
ncbi:hypothetical protein GTQ40_12755 [Flavobacteriaceae bacterium R38]|nr:hypothetical protein [Flavobacteriaceae bacterium R38]